MLINIINKLFFYIQALKYDNDSSSLEDLNEDAIFAKEEGNKHFKAQKYRWAIESYTNGMVINKKI